MNYFMIFELEHIIYYTNYLKNTYSYIVDNGYLLFIYKEL